jgi:cobalamin synthase
MEYITTFDNVFFFLLLLLTAAAVAGLVCGCLFKTDEQKRNLKQTAQEYRHYINAFWAIMLFVSGVNSPEGTTTFLALCFVVGFVVGIILRRKVKHDLMDYSMVDLSGYIREEINGKITK